MLAPAYAISFFANEPWVARKAALHGVDYLPEDVAFEWNSYSVMQTFQLSALLPVWAMFAAAIRIEIGNAILAVGRIEILGKALVISISQSMISCGEKPSPCESWHYPG